MPFSPATSHGLLTPRRRETSARRKRRICRRFNGVFFSEDAFLGKLTVGAKPVERSPVKIEKSTTADVF
jgi:hypothetical protein